MRMEYELRQKAIRDHNMMMKTARKHGYESGYEMGEKHGFEAGEKHGYEVGEKRGLEIGEKRGLEIGEKRGERLALKKIIDKLTGDGRTIEETAELLGFEPEMVEEISKME